MIFFMAAGFSAGFVGREKLGIVAIGKAISYKSSVALFSSSIQPPFVF
jgi:hypothetical protein